MAIHRLGKRVSRRLESADGLDPHATGAVLNATVAHARPARAPRRRPLAWRGDTLIAVGDDGRGRGRISTTRRRSSTARGSVVVPGLVDSHIHPFHGTLLTRGVDLRGARTIDEVRAPAAHRARPHADRGSGCSGTRWATRRFARPASAPTQIEDARRRPAGAAELLRRAHRPGLGRRRCGGRASTARASSPRTPRSSATPTGRPTGALLELGAMSLVRDSVPEWTRAERLDAYAGTLRALNAVGLTGAHVMLGDPELLDDVPRARGARRADPADGGPDALRSVDGRGGDRAPAGARRRARAPVARGHGEVLPRRSDGERHRLADRAGARAASTPCPSGPSQERYRGARPPLHRGRLRLHHATPSATGPCGRRWTPTRRPGRRGGACTGSSTSRRFSTRTCRGSPSSGSPPRCSRCTWRDSTAASRPPGSTGSRPGVSSAAGAAPRSPAPAPCSRSGRTGWWPTTTRASAWPGRDCAASPGEPDRTPYLPEQALSPARTLPGYTTCPAAITGDGDRAGRLTPGSQRRPHRAGREPARDRARRASGRPGAG